MKKLFVLLTICLGSVACKDITADFTYSPEQPKAGETITFTNTSNGDKWSWDFGDATTSTSKNPTKTFKKSGVYAVRLKVNGKSSATKTKQITIYDTVPSFMIFMGDDTIKNETIPAFTNLKLYAMVYNPYGYTNQFQWDLDENAVWISGKASSTATVYFKKYNYETTIQMNLTQNGKTFQAKKTFFVKAKESYAVLMRNSEKTFRQRIYDDLGMGMVEEVNYPEAKVLLDASQNGSQTLNGQEVTTSNLSTKLGETVLGFRIDPLTQKVYYYTSNGLFVSNFDGSNKKSISSETTKFVWADNQSGLLFWATQTSAFYMPLIQSPTNSFETKNITKLNDEAGITAIAVDPQVR